MLAMDRVSKRFGDTLAVDGISFEAAPGRITAVIGPNGAGKSTAFRIIAGVLNPDGGEVRWEGQLLRDALPRERIGFLPEERGLYQDLRVEHVLAYWAALRGLGKREARAVMDRWLERLDLTTKRRELVRALSKGNQQKLQLCACLLHDPSLLVLDEPFSGLDPINQELVCSILAEQCQRGAVVLISAHQLSLVERIADHVLILSKGAILDAAAVRGDPPPRLHAGKSWVVRIRSNRIEELETHLRAAGGEPLEPASGNTLRTAFSNLTLEQFFLSMSEIAANPAIIDIEVERDDLHRKYVALVAAGQGK